MQSIALEKTSFYCEKVLSFIMENIEHFSTDVWHLPLFNDFSTWLSDDDDVVHKTASLSFAVYWLQLRCLFTK